MKKDLHPQYFADSTITCSCGAVHQIPGTVKEIHTEICSQCHPFYTGKVKLIDTAGRIDKFRARQDKKSK